MRRLGMSAGGRSTYEIIIIFVAVVLTGALAVGLYAERNKVHKGRMLASELSSLRTSVALYTFVNRKHPPSLNAVVEETYEAGDGSRRHFAEYVHSDDDGRLIDPFGSAYVYDPDKGWVSSATEGYLTW
jgi:hypothetical protein